MYSDPTVRFTDLVAATETEASKISEDDFLDLSEIEI